MPQQASLVARALAEFFGTFMLVFVVLNLIIGGSKIGAIAAASALMIAVYCTGAVSGGHLNPAVSFGIALMSMFNHGDFSFGEFAVYVLAQLLGAFAGSLKGAVGVWHMSLWGPTTTIVNSSAIVLGNMTSPMQNHLIGSNQTNVSALDGGLVSIGFAEMIYTAVLVFVVLNVATCDDHLKGTDDNRGKNSYFGLAIGFVVAAGASAVGSISMCALNPAVAFGIAFTDIAVGNLPWMDYTKTWPGLMFIYYTLVEFVGAAVACILFMICRDKIGRPRSADAAPSMAARFLSEVLGTFVLCLTVMLVVHAPASPVGCVGIAASLMVMIYALGAVSGANFNPAVSLALVVVRALTIAEFAIYVAAQLLGALLALITSRLMLGRIDEALVAKDVVPDSGKFGLAGGSWSAVITAEMVFTWMLVFTVLNVAIRDAPNQYYGLAIGFVIIVGAASVGGISGGCFNPAVALMLDLGGLVGNEFAQYGWGFVYAFFQLVAAAIAAACYLCIGPFAGAEEFEGLEDEEQEEDYEEEDP